MFLAPKNNKPRKSLSASRKPDRKEDTTLPVQMKPTVNALNDPLEEEADATADQVMQMPEVDFVQRKCTECEKEQEENMAPDAVSSGIEATKGGGRPMAAETRNFMESRFGTDFGTVRIHTDHQASELSEQLNAKAFTVDKDIYFKGGEYSPQSQEGKHLLAHELTHVVQQNGDTQGAAIQRQADPAGTMTLRLKEDGTIEIIAGTPKLPAVGSLGAGFRCKDGKCQPVFGENPFSDATKESYTIDEAKNILSGIGGKPGGSPSTGGTPVPWPSPSLPGLNSPAFPCPPGKESVGGLCLTPFPKPSAKPMVPLTGSFSLGTIDNFSINSSQLPSDRMENLKAVGDQLKTQLQLCPNSLVTVTGHTDAKGPDALNTTLGQDRAEAVKFYLQLHLFPLQPAMIIASSAGSSSLLVDTPGYEPRNRRVEVKFYPVCPPLELKGPGLFSK